MKSKLPTLVLTIALLFGSTIVPILAQSNNTLEWGVDVGEEFIYVLQRAHYSSQSDKEYMEGQLPFLAEIQEGEKVIVEIAFLEAIEDLINDSTQLPRSYCNLRRFNDSALIMSDLTSLVLPVGDWEFLTEINNMTTTPGITPIDSAEEWGSIGVGTFSSGDGSSVDVRLEMRYEKENGTLNYLRHRYTTLGTDIIDVVFVNWHEGMPTVIAGDIQSTTLLLIVTSGLFGLFAAFLAYRSIKGKKTVAHRLGE
ncbi:MAG: hypothetical protein ACFFCP_11205 [Promethearchaeota archaeon]